MSKLRTIIRLYEDCRGLKTISDMARTSRNTVKKYVNIWNSMDMSYDEFQSKSDAELNELFCVADSPSSPNPRMDTLVALMPSICKELGKKGMTSHKQWEKYMGAMQFIPFHLYNDQNKYRRNRIYIALLFL